MLFPGCVGFRVAADPVVYICQPLLCHKQEHVKYLTQLYTVQLRTSLPCKNGIRICLFAVGKKNLKKLKKKYTYRTLPNRFWHLLKWSVEIMPRLFQSKCFRFHFTESQNHHGWKRPLRSSSPTIHLSPTKLSIQNPNVPWTPPGLVTPPPPWAALAGQARNPQIWGEDVCLGLVQPEVWTEEIRTYKPRNSSCSSFPEMNWNYRFFTCILISVFWALGAEGLRDGAKILLYLQTVCLLLYCPIETTPLFCKNAQLVAVSLDSLIYFLEIILAW